MLSIHKIGIIGRTYRHVGRYRQILTILVKYGFGDLLDTLKTEQYIEMGIQLLSKKRREHVTRLSRAERVRMALVELGTTFIKLGQILSTRPDLIPVEFIEELSKLQDDVPPFPYIQVRQIIESELRVPLEDVFQGFEQTPLAAASIGQVHKARLKDGEEVAVKVQRPGIRKTVEVDLEIMLHLASLMEKHIDEAAFYQPLRIVEEFARSIEMELDYSLEAGHMERFAWMFISDNTVYVPKVFQGASTARVLTMEYIDGIKASDKDLAKKTDFDKKEITRRGANLILKQIFNHGFFHADPHPGNVFILKNNVVCYLDFGLMGRIDLAIRDRFADLIMGIVQHDEQKTASALLRLTLWEDEPERSLLERDLSEFMDRHFYRPLKELDLGKFLHQLLDIGTRHRLRLEPDFFLMLKALSTMESLGRALNPDFDIIGHAEPFIRRLKLARSNPKRIARDVMRSSTELIDFLKEIPHEARRILKQARQGKVKMEFEHRGLAPMLFTLNQISNRIAFAIVLASLVIGSSIVVLSGVPPTWHEIPIIGLAGFVAAGIMAFWLLISILMRGKM